MRFNRTDYEAPSFAGGDVKSNVFYFDVCRYWPVIPVVDPTTTVEPTDHVIKTYGAGVVAGTDTAGTVLKHPLERDALLCRAGHRGLGRLFAVLILFQKRNHGRHLPSQAGHSNCGSGTDAPSGEQSAPESSTAGYYF